MALNQVIEADVVYVKDFRYPDRLSDDHLRRMALIADACYYSYDLALYCISQLQRRGSVESGASDAYLALVNERLRENTQG